MATHSMLPSLTLPDSCIDLDAIFGGQIDDEVLMYQDWYYWMFRWARQRDFCRAEVWAERLVAVARLPLLLRAHALTILSKRGNPGSKGRALEAIECLKKAEEAGFKVSPQDLVLAYRVLADVIEEEAKSEPYKAMEAELAGKETEAGNDATNKEEAAGEAKVTDMASSAEEYDGDENSG